MDATQVDSDKPDDQLLRARADLDALDGLATSEHPAVFSRIHSSLVAALSAATVDPAPGSSEAR